ncbi:MAG: hypothetical protein K6E78_01530, partial [Treponema sp.]|nr:hypothetical protein [Treponema sp.]
MRLRKMFLIAAALLSTTSIFAEEEEAKSGGNFFTNLLNNENLELKVVTDFAYYPKSDYVAGSSHFAPITG